MTFDVKFDMDPMTLDVSLGEIYDVSEGEAERIYQEGYTEGKTAGYADGQAAEQAVVDSIIGRSIKGAYRNDRVTSIGEYAFYNCAGLTKVDFPQAKTIETNAFAYCSHLPEVNFPQVTSLKGYAFFKCSNLTEVDFPLLTSIGAYAFSGCSKLTHLNIPLLESIDSNGFKDCDSLTEVSFPSLRDIGNNAFRSCLGLSEVNLEMDLPQMGYIRALAFNNCAKLAKLILRNSKVVYTLSGTNAFTNTPIKKSGEGYIYVPDDLVDSYKTATNWSTFATQIKPLSELEE